jgi:hypothetical protein
LSSASALAIPPMKVRMTRRRWRLPGLAAREALEKDEAATRAPTDRRAVAAR